MVKFLRGQFEATLLKTRVCTQASFFQVYVFQPRLDLLKSQSNSYKVPIQAFSTANSKDSFQKFPIKTKKVQSVLQAPN